MSADHLLEGLNPAQYEAVTHGEGPLLVVAGAGSGKTRVLTHRIAHLIEEHRVSPFEILAITFTNKAAGEMKERIGKLVGPVAEKMWISTFHSACVRILRRDAQRLGYPSAFTIYDQADAVRLTGYVIRDLNIDPKRFPPRSVHATISAAKNEGLDAEEYTERASVIHERKIADVFTEYQARLLKAGAMDFDDLLGVTVDLLRREPEVLEHYQRRFGNVLVDEYQDTNPVQNDLVMLLGEDHRNVCVVGDLDQCLPPGTMVRTPTGSVPVEQVQVGDQVLGTWGGTDLRPSTVSAVKTGSLPGVDRRGPRREHRAHRDAAPHRSRPDGCRRGHPPRVPHVPSGPRLPHRSDQSGPLGQRAQTGDRLPGPDEPGAWRQVVGAPGLRLAGRVRLSRVMVRRALRPADGLLPCDRPRSHGAR